MEKEEDKKRSIFARASAILFTVDITHMRTPSSLPFPSSTSMFHVIGVTLYCPYLLSMDGALIDLMHKLTTKVYIGAILMLTNGLTFRTNN